MVPYQTSEQMTLVTTTLPNGLRNSLYVMVDKMFSLMHIASACLIGRAFLHSDDRPMRTILFWLKPTDGFTWLICVALNLDVFTLLERVDFACPKQLSESWFD